MSLPLKPSTIFQNIPCTLVTGFLGAGKTTVINQLLATKPTDERWALLINEFGRIGIDGALLASSQDNTAEQDSIAIREVSGGCICCTSQLPLQIAISRLLSDHHPQRLLIEPTGLAHPRELIRQLSAPHWQTALKMQAVITVLSGVQWQQVKYRTHEGFQAHVRDADVLVVNRYDQLNASEKQALIEWIAMLNSQTSIIWAVSEPMTTDTTEASGVGLAEAYAAALSTQLSKPSQVISAQRKVAIARPQRSTVSLRPQTNSLAMAPSASTAIDESDTQNITDTDLPYRYHENQQDLTLAGWRLPASYRLNADDLQNWLLALPNWQRIKGVVHTSDGWLQINFTPDSLTTSTVDAQPDSRLEIILQLEDISDTAVEATDPQYPPKSSTAIDWEACDRELMAMVIVNPL
ncbi:GTP-binding protein [Psychrobacter sp. NG254]|uniref:CobW family GTP-binding protein n=1 Tax=Psychrobacter sp. NG254 TaxID=2782003 RepID=UPI0018887899|nr:CobW family GTP-binding protein [Psychrobacter sp. NG254]MBF2718995.1 GTP-binding protein [Psychrobacter sp. NG254]